MEQAHAYYLHGAGEALQGVFTHQGEALGGVGLAAFAVEQVAAVPVSGHLVAGLVGLAEGLLRRYVVAGAHAELGVGVDGLAVA